MRRIYALLLALLLLGAGGCASGTAAAPEGTAAAALLSDAATVPSTEPEPVSAAVYITRTGEKYHVEGCQYLRESKISTTLTRAKAEGCGPCAKCGPPR